jgi:hypothetical protein
VLLVVKVLKEL